jgi:hypothetical protein
MDRKAVIGFETWMRPLVEKMHTRRPVIYVRDLEAIAKIGIIFGETYITET